MNFADHIDYAARSNPNRTAIAYPSRDLSYSELQSQADRFASALRANGFEPGDVLAIYAPNTPELVIAVLACLKSGINHLPLNLRFEQDELAYVLEDANARGIFATDTFVDPAIALHNRIDSLDTAILTTDHDEAHLFDDFLTDGKLGGRNHPAKSDDIAGIMYTSGTTGKPKGVQHTHQNYIANAMGFNEIYRLFHATNTVTVAPCFHVAGLNITLTPTLVAGGTAGLLPQWDPEAFLEQVVELEAHYSFIVPTMMTDLLHLSDADEYDLSHMESMIVGSAAVPEHAITEFETQFGATVTEGYGMTETTPLSILNQPDDKQDGTIGKAYERLVDVKITDPDTREKLPPGEIGEITVRGETVTPGYYELPDVNAEQFDGGWLYTGDLGWVGEDGYYRIEDRVDDMIITGGENVYPAEVENVVSSHQGVRDVAVIGTTDERFGEAVTAVITRANADLTSEKIIEYCRDSDSLANYKRPRQIEFVDDLPKTETRKIDKVELRERFD